MCFADPYVVCPCLFQGIIIFRLSGPFGTGGGWNLSYKSAKRQAQGAYQLCRTGITKSGHADSFGYDGYCYSMCKRKGGKLVGRL